MNTGKRNILSHKLVALIVTIGGALAAVLVGGIIASFGGAMRKSMLMAYDYMSSYSMDPEVQMMKSVSSAITAVGIAIIVGGIAMAIVNGYRTYSYGNLVERLESIDRQLGGPQPTAGVASQAAPARRQEAPAPGKVCTTCGTLNRPDSAFCVKCGKTL